jgi:hypothetical protein
MFCGKLARCTTLLALGIVPVAVLGADRAHATTYTFTTGLQGSSAGSLDASGTVTTENGDVVISLTNLVANLTSAGQEISGINVSFGSAVAGGLLGLHSFAGTTAADLNCADAPIDEAENVETHWGVGTPSATQITLETAGSYARRGQPIDLIIGPGNSSDDYTHANGSVLQHAPFILDTGTFTIADSAITANTTVTGVTVLFGTSPDYSAAAIPTLVSSGTGGTTAPIPVPEHMSLMVLGLGFAALTLTYRSRPVG